MMFCLTRIVPRAVLMVVGAVFLLGLISAQTARGEPTLRDRIVAVVNGDLILYSDLMAATREVANLNPNRANNDALRTATLDALINERLQLQAARRMGIAASQRELNDYAARLAADNGQSTVAFFQALRNQGLDIDRLREGWRKRLIIERLQQQILAQQSEVSEAEIDRYLAEVAQTQNAFEYRLDILLVEGNATDAAATVAVINNKLAAGVPFDAVRLEYGAALPLDSGRYQSAANLPDIFVQALEQLAVGEVSPAITSPLGVYKIKLLDKRVRAQQQSARYKLRQVFLSYLTYPNDAMMQQAMDDFAAITEQAAATDWIKEHSEDEYAMRAGLTDWVAHYELPPEVQADIARAPLNAFRTVRVGRGVMHYEVLEKAIFNASADIQREMARQAIRLEQAEDDYRQYVENLREHSEVKQFL